MVTYLLSNIQGNLCHEVHPLNALEDQPNLHFLNISSKYTG